MNDRADRLIKALGDIGEDLIEKAAPVYPDDSGAGESIRTAVPAVYEPEVKITRKDRVIYWVTHSLGVAAAAILIIGAAVLLIMNWDKIAVKEPERPGAIVKYIEELPDISEAYGKTIEFSDASVRISSVTYDGTSLNARFYLLFKGNDEFYSPAVWINVEGAEHGDPNCAINPVMDADSYDYLIQCSVPVELEPGNSYAVNIVYKGNGNLENDTQKYRFTCPDIPAVTAATTTNNPYFTSAVEPLIEPDEADPFGQITDTNMPEPYDSMEYPLGNFDFYSQWKPKFFYTDLLTETDSEKRKEFHKRLADIQTPYTLFDSPNLYAIAKAVGFTSDDIENELRKRNETYSASGDISKVFSDYEIMVLSHSNDSLSISATFASEYSIYMNTYVFSPKWLYYHTIEDYKAAGIDPYSMHSLLEKYSELGLTDEAWAAFSAKLQKFIGADIPPDTFTYDRPAGSWFELEETLYRIDHTAPFDCVTFNDDGTCSSIFIDEWKEEYDAIGYTSELENITDENFVFTFGFMKQPGEEPRSGSDPDLIRVYSADYKNADKGEALAMRNKYVTMPLNENQIMYIDKYMRDKLNVPYDSIVWDDVYGVYYVDTQKRCELMPDRYYSEVNDDLRHDLFEAMYEADRNAEMDGNPGATYYHTNPLPIAGSDEYIAFWVSGEYKARILVTYIIRKDFEGQYKAEQKTDITDELDRLYIDGAKLMFVKSGGGYYAVTESNRKIELIPGDEGAVSNYEAKFAYRVRPYLPLPDGAAEDIKLGEEQKRLLIKEAYESAQSFENSISLDRLAVSDPVKISEQQFFIFVFDGDEIVGKIWCFYSDSTENASGFDTGGYDNAVDGLTELYRSGEKVSFTWFGSNLYCCPENAVSYPTEWQVFHKPSYVYLYDAEQGAPIHRNNAE